MPDHRPVPQIGRGPSQFSRANAQPVQSPMMAGQPQPAVSPEEAIAEAMADMAMEIYVRLVVSDCAKHGMPRSADSLAQVAQQAQLAAKAYFESMGVQFDHAQS